MKKKTFYLIALLFVFSIACKEQKRIYSDADNQIELDATRQQIDLQDDVASFTGMSTKDGRFWDYVYPEVKGIPDSLSNIQVYYSWFNNIQALYQSYKAGVVSKEDFDYYYKGWGADTTYCIPDFVKTFVIIASGESQNGQKYYLFDSDNDFDLGDEVLIQAKESDFYSIIQKTYKPYKIIYEKVVNKTIQNDSTWIAFFENNGNMNLHVNEKASATFQFDSVNYIIDVRPSTSKRYRGGTSYKISSGFNKKSKDYKVGEYAKFGNNYYKLNCSSDGLKIYLTKVDDAFKHGGTQIGMPPLTFKAKTYLGDSINFPSDYKGKYVLLDFWSIGCAPCVQEMKDYYIDIYKKFGGTQFEIIGVADNSSNELENFINDNKIKWTIIPDGESRNIQKKYHISYYPTLYFIDPSGNIIAKEGELREGRFVSILEENIKPN